MFGGAHVSARMLCPGSCDKCESGSDDTQCHAMICNGWKKEREGLDLTVMSDMVVFFTRILKKKGVKRD